MSASPVTSAAPEPRILTWDEYRPIAVPPSAMPTIPLADTSVYARTRLPPGQAVEAQPRLHSAPRLQRAASFPLPKNAITHGPAPWPLRFPLAYFVAHGNGDPRRVEHDLLESLFPTDASFTGTGELNALYSFAFLLEKCRLRLPEPRLQALLAQLGELFCNVADMAFVKTCFQPRGYGEVIEHGVLARLARHEPVLCQGGWQSPEDSHLALVYIVPNPGTGQSLLSINNRNAATDPYHVVDARGRVKPILLEIPTAFLTGREGQRFFASLLAMQKLGPDSENNAEAFYALFGKLLHESHGRALLPATLAYPIVDLPGQKPQDFNGNCGVLSPLAVLHTALHLWYGSINTPPTASFVHETLQAQVQDKYRLVKRTMREIALEQGILALKVARKRQNAAEVAAMTASLRAAQSWVGARLAKHPEFAPMAALLRSALDDGAPSTL